MMDIWAALLWNSFAAHVLFSPVSDTILYGFAAFGRADWMPALAVAVFAGTLANFATYVLGIYLSTFKDRKKFALDEIQYATIQRLVRRYGVFVLLVQAFPFYGVLPLVMGFFRVKAWHALPLIAIGLAVHHYLNMTELMALIAR